MFDLNEAIRSWTGSVFSARPEDHDRIAELEDHLYSAVLEMVRAGMSEKAAFDDIIARIGDRKTLSEEYDKNHAFLETLCETLKKYENWNGSDQGMLTKNRIRNTLIVMLLYLLLLVLILFGTSQILGGGDAFEKASLVIFFLWLGPLLVFTSSQGSGRSEWNWLRRKFRRRDQ